MRNGRFGFIAFFCGFIRFRIKQLLQKMVADSGADAETDKTNGNGQKQFAFFHVGGRLLLRMLRGFSNCLL